MSLKVKFIRGYSKWFKLPKENLVKVVVDNDSLPGPTRKFICEALLTDVLTYADVKTFRRRYDWARKHPEWENLDVNRIARQRELEEEVEKQKLAAIEEANRLREILELEERLLKERLEKEARELAERFEPELDSWESDCD